MQRIVRVGLGLAGGLCVYSALALVRGRSCGVTGLVEAVTHPVAEALADPVAGSRLKGQYELGTDGSRQYDGTLMYDSGETCAYGTAEDGVTRCLPTSITPIIDGPPNQPGGPQYLDSACTQAFVAQQPPTNGCAATPVAKYFVVYSYTSPLCGDAVRITNYYPYGSFIATPPAYWIVDAGGNCVAGNGSFAAYALFSIGPKVDVSRFVAGTLGVDP